jgi:hypothetical protein
MNHLRRYALWIFVAVCFSPAFAQHTYFISTSGSDTNTSTQAQSKTTPWAHLPGMLSASGNVAAYTPVAGDTFVLKGCDDWGNANFPITWAWSGTSGSHITIGVDQTWSSTCTAPAWAAATSYFTNTVIIPTTGNAGGFAYSPQIPTHASCTSGGTQPATWNQTIGGTTTDNNCTWYNSGLLTWNRPIFDGGGSVINPPECGTSNHNIFIRTGSTSFVDWNWIELANYFSNNGSGTGCFTRDGWIIPGTTGDHQTFNDFYIHSTVNGASSLDNDGMISAEGANTCPNCAVTFSVIDNSDGTHFTAGGIQFPLQHSICSYLSNCIKPATGGEYAYNDITQLGQGIAGVHANCIETLGGTATPYYIHDNRIHDNVTCESLQVGNPSETDYVWNNLFYNDNGTNGPNIPQSCSTGVTGIWYVNNTNVDGRNSCLSYSGCSGANWTSFAIFQNNMCLTSGTPSGTAQSGNLLSGGASITGATTITFSNNLVESQATGTSQGYTSAQSPYVYFPPNGSAATVGTGTNLTSAWLPGGGFSTSDTTYACTEQTVSGVVQSVCSQRTSNSRPTGSTAWDIGAYQFSSGVTPAIAPSVMLTKWFVSRFVH